MKRVLRNNSGCITALTLLLGLICYSLDPNEAAAQRLPGAVLPVQYSLTLTPDLNTATFRGEETVYLMVREPVVAITMNAAELTFQTATVVIEGKAQHATITLDDKKEQVTFSFDRKLATGPLTLSIEYSGILNNQLRGFYLSKTAKRNYAVTQFEATDARRAFACFDEPAFKATYDLTLVVNEGDTAISNTNVVSDTPGPLAGMHSIRFATTPKMSTYLVAFLVGDFHCVSGGSDGVPIRACSTPGNEALGKYAITSAEFFLHYFDQYFGIKYPMPKLDMIALPDFEAGAMENFGAITYRETDLLIDERTASPFEKQRVALVVAHEMAHQWFGDMVTMQWWDNVWLNEGFATWMENKALAAWKPEWQIPQSVAADLQTTLDRDSRAKTRTIRADADTPAQINEMFDGIAYGKAGATLGMVENYLGEQTFRRGVHDYLAAHLYGNATAEDFWNAETAVSHKPVDEIMQSMVTEPGVPLLTFSEARDGKVSVSQQRFWLNPALSSAQRASKPQSWTLPVCLHRRRPSDQARDGGIGSTSCTVVSGDQPSLRAGNEELFFANAGGVGYFRSIYPSAMRLKLATAVETALDARERISLLGDELALMHAGKIPVSEYLELVSSVKDDTSSRVMKSALDGAAMAQGQIAANEEERAKMARWIRKTFGGALASLGEPAAGESPDRTALRVVLFKALGESGRDPAVIEKAKKIAAQYFIDPRSVDPALTPPALAIAAMHGDAALFDQLQRTFESSPNPQSRATALFALGDFRDPALEERALDYAVSGKVRNQDSAGLVGRILGERDTRDIAWLYIQAHWDKVKAQLTKWGGSSVVGGASSFCTAQARDEVASFFAGHMVPSSQRSLNNAVDQISDCVALRAAQGPALKVWLQGKD